jgi:hypothetical protein
MAQHRASGERRSEVKGESRAQTGSADMSEVARRLLCRQCAASNNTAGFCSTRFGVGKMGALLRNVAAVRTTLGMLANEVFQYVLSPVEPLKI